MVYSVELKIPIERIAVVIGTKGSVKNRLEKDFDSKINIDNEGLIVITGEDSIKIWILEKIIKLISRGFNPELALLLKNDTYDSKIVNLNDYIRGKNDLKRIKGRIIGREGSCQKQIEDKTGSYLVIYGKTVAIIALNETMEIVSNAIEMLCKGARHVSVFRYIDRENQKRLRNVMLNG